MQFFPKKTLNCLRDCNGACCHDMTIKVIGVDEFQTLQKFRENGLKTTTLEEYPDFPVGMYKVEGDCPFRNGGKNGKGCAIYGKERLGSCGATACGGEGCKELRSRDGYK